MPGKSADRRRRPWRPRRRLLQSAFSLDSPVLFSDFQPKLVVSGFRNRLLQLKMKLLFQSRDSQLKGVCAADELDVAVAPGVRVAWRIVHHGIPREGQRALRTLCQPQLLYRSEEHMSELQS